MTTISEVSAWLHQQHISTRSVLINPASAAGGTETPNGAEAPGSIMGIAGISCTEAVAALDADGKLAELLKEPDATKPGTPAFNDLVNQFIKSPLSGIATVTNMALRKSQWKPQDPSAPANHAALEAYGKNLASSPFFSLKSTVEVGSLSQLKPTSQTAPAKEDPAFTVAALQRNVLGFLFTPPLTFVENRIVANSGGKFQFILSVYGIGDDPNSVTFRQTAWEFRSEFWTNFAETVATSGVNNGTFATAESWLAKFGTPRLSFGVNTGESGGSGAGITAGSGSGIGSGSVAP